jgi:hypothetical protein
MIAHRGTASKVGFTGRTRRSGAVLAGVLVVLAIATDIALHASGVFPPTGQTMAGGFFMLATLYRIVYAVAGRYVAARLAPDRTIQLAVALGVIGLASSLVGAAATWNAGPCFGPRRCPFTLTAIAMPYAWAGGKLRNLQLGK